MAFPFPASPNLPIDDHLTHFPSNPDPLNLGLALSVTKKLKSPLSCRLICIHHSCRQREFYGYTTGILFRVHNYKRTFEHRNFNEIRAKYMRGVTV